MTNIWLYCKGLSLSFVSSVLFYTSIPLPYVEGLDFRKVARFAPAVGLMLGTILALLETSLIWMNVPILTRSVLLVCVWVVITGGLHLDGAMDTADGLAVTNAERRLEVMADSRTGAFGAITAILILFLKVAALHDIEQNRWFLLIVSCGWGRWGQVMAIWRYPYLKPCGKGAFHKEAIRSPLDLLLGLSLLLGISMLQVIVNPALVIFASFTVLVGIIVSISTGAWLNHKLGGHTGDTYGAVVEWTEALFLCVMTTNS
ncbi:MAG: adenosylcobinamide-GDP ribazoletransferase [Calothrix sp. C42_A2020_038]|nr:adenosylcobinamide-GDP ribazoletransferase [Calothrix sp. C42_A2020_038]